MALLVLDGRFPPAVIGRRQRPATDGQHRCQTSRSAYLPWSAHQLSFFCRCVAAGAGRNLTRRLAFGVAALLASGAYLNKFIK